MAIDLSLGVTLMLEPAEARLVKSVLRESETIAEFVRDAIMREHDEREQLRARGDLPDDEQRPNPSHPPDCRCGGAGWVWRHELPDTSDWDGGADDTRYLCPYQEEKGKLDASPG